MSKPVINFTGAIFTQGGTFKYVINGALFTRAIQRIQLADGTLYQKTKPDWRWEKWIGDKFSRQHSKTVPGHWWRCTTMHAWILDRAWQEHLRRKADAASFVDDVCARCGGSGHDPEDKGECCLCNGYGHKEDGQ